MKKSHDVSVIVPVYNSSKYIKLTLESILSQRDCYLQLIIVNDGSEDNSIQLINEILECSSIDYIIINQENKGLSSARNVGYLRSNARYVSFVDSDDYLVDTHFSSLVNFADENQLDLSYSDYEFTYEINRYGSEIIYPAHQMVFSTLEFLRLFIYRDYNPHLCTFLFKKESLILGQNLFNEKLRFAEDNYFFWWFFNKELKIGFLNLKSYKYLQRSNSLMSSQKLTNIKTFISEFSTLVDSNDLYKGLKEDEIVTGYTRLVLALLRSNIKHSKSLPNFLELYKSLFSQGNLILNLKTIKSNQIIRYDIKFYFLISKYSVLYFYLIIIHDGLIDIIKYFNKRIGKYNIR